MPPDPQGFDTRIAQCIQAALQLKDGQYRIQVPLGTSDLVAQLGTTLQELGQTLEAARRIQQITDLTHSINEGLHLDEILERMYRDFHSIIPYNRISLSLIEEKGSRLVTRWVQTDYQECRIKKGHSTPLRGSSLEKILATGHPRILNNLDQYLKGKPSSGVTRLVIEEGIRSSLACPLISGGVPIGFLFFDSCQPDAYAHVHVEIYQHIAEQLSVIVEKGRLVSELAEQKATIQAKNDVLREVNCQKNAFLGMVVHDLRNPLSSIRSFLRLFITDKFGPLAAEQKMYLENMEATCAAMLELINDLLDISAIESGSFSLNFRRVNPSEFLRNCHRSCAVLAREKSIELLLELEEDLPELDMDSLRIDEVMNNLISNALKFSQPKTQIVMRARKIEGRVVFSVQDQGPGIPSDEIPKLFKEFARGSVKSTAGEKSTGLGLAIVKRLVEAHSGCIWVDSEVGKGSTFSFSLAVHPSSPHSEKKLPRTP